MLTRSRVCPEGFALIYYCIPDLCSYRSKWFWSQYGFFQDRFVSRHLHTPCFVEKTMPLPRAEALWSMASAIGWKESFSGYDRKADEDRAQWTFLSQSREIGTSGTGRPGRAQAISSSQFHIDDEGWSLRVFRRMAQAACFKGSSKVFGLCVISSCYFRWLTMVWFY